MIKIVIFNDKKAILKKIIKTTHIKKNDKKMKSHTYSYIFINNNNKLNKRTKNR